MNITIFQRPESSVETMSMDRDKTSNRLNKDGAALEQTEKGMVKKRCGLYGCLPYDLSKSVTCSGDSVLPELDATIRPSLHSPQVSV